MTNAEYIEAIGARCSRRTYSHTPPDPRVLEILQEMVDAVNRQSGLSFRLLADGTAPFTLFTGKFALVAVCGPDTEWARIQSGYFGESIVLQCVYHGLGTCWVTGTYNENKLYQMLDLPRDLRLYGVITIGNVKPGKSMKEKMMYNATHKTNKPYQKMMEACDRALPEPYVFAMQMVEKAPSATNRRCVRFRYEEGKISASVDAPYSDKSLDFGIAQLHFQLGAAHKGVQGKWNKKGEFVTDDKVIKFPTQSEGKKKMSKTAVKKEKKKWSTGKKVAVILCSVLLALILIVVSGGLIYLHNYCQVKDYTVTAMGNHDVTLIAHRGFRAVAPENTLPAFEEAGKAGFTGAECDTYRTKDGVWVISHDSHTYRMMDQHAFVEKKTYDELLTYNTDNGVNIDQYPNLKICTLEDYLKTCVQYNMTAVIELKGKNNTEHYDEIMKLVADTGAKPLFISFHLENLQQIRKLSQDVPVWYLVQKIDDQAIADAKALGGECGIDFNGNKDENTKEVVQKCLDAGLEVGAWTIDDMDTLQSLKDKGVTYITTDSITY